MGKRNSNKIIALAAILLTKASKDNGLTVTQMVEETEIPRATIHRLLSEPGFSKCVESKYPPQYYFDPVFQLPDPSERTVDQRNYNKQIDTLPIRETFPVLYEVNERLTQPVQEALYLIAKTIDNVAEFKRGESKLNTDKLKELRETIDTAQYKLETYYQFLDKYNVDFDNPTWWESF